jgi:predicted DNA-binding transcriptional regulator YafY
LGQKGADDTVAAIFVALLERRTWRQSELARHVGVRADRVRRVLSHLQTRGIPVERQEDHPHVYWSVPREWFPGGVALTRAEAAAMRRLVGRLEPQDSRDALMQKLIGDPTATPLHSGVDPGPRLPDDRILDATEDALRRGAACELRYDGENGVQTRTVTPHRLVLRPRPRMVASCHWAGELRWFRLDRIMNVREAPEVEAISVSMTEVDQFVADSVDGFRRPAKGGDVWFEVRGRDARWVKLNLPTGARATDVAGGIVVRARATGLIPLARFCVGLGSALAEVSPPLAEAIAQLATESLQAVGAAPSPSPISPGAGQPLNAQPVRPNRVSG